MDDNVGNIKQKLQEIIASTAPIRAVRDTTYVSICTRYGDEIHALKMINGFTYKEIEQILKNNNISVPWYSIRSYIQNRSKLNGK